MNFFYPVSRAMFFFFLFFCIKKSVRKLKELFSGSLLKGSSAETFKGQVTCGYAYRQLNHWQIKWLAVDDAGCTVCNQHN